MLLLVSAQLLLAVVLQARPLGEYSASCDPMSWGYRVMLLLFALMPFMLSRRSQQQG